MKDYEYYKQSDGINLKFILFGAVLIIIFMLLVAPAIITKPVKNTTPNATVIVIREYVTVTITPTIDGREYFASEYNQGLRKIGREFSFTEENVSGFKNINVHTNVYDYREFNSYHWFNPTDYKYYEQYPSDLNKKFVFLFHYMYMDDVIGDNAPIWIPTEKQFALQCGDNMYSPVSMAKQVRIRELENVFNTNDDYPIQYFGTFRMYANTEDNRKTAGEYAEQITRLKGGKSNKVDGYLVFEVDKTCNAENMIANVNYFAFGDSSWRLKV
jgi:hypothetical protein